MQFPGRLESRAWNTLRFLRDGDALMASLELKYGHQFLMRISLGDVLLVCRPPEIQQLFALPSEYISSFTDKLLEPLVGRQSLFQLSGDAHRRMHRILMPHFQRAQMKRFGEDLLELVPRHARRQRVGKPFRMIDAMRHLVMEAMMRALFGLIEPSRLERYVSLFIELDRRATGALFYLYEQRALFLGLGPWRAFTPVHRRVCEMIGEDIRACRERHEPGPGILDALASLQDEHGAAVLDDDALLDNVMTLVVAGYETVASSLAWAYFWIHRDPARLQRVLDEVDGLGPDPSAEDFAALPFLGAVCSESLRRSPVINLTAWRVQKAFRLGGREVRPGMNVGVSITNAHCNPDLYPDPLAFRPERFLERQFGAHEYVPFGGGVRRCLGAVLAVFEMKVVLGASLRQFRYGLADHRIPGTRLHGVVLVPKNGIPMVLEGERNGGTSVSPGASAGLRWSANAGPGR